MAARSCDHIKFQGIGAQVLIAPDMHTKFQRFRCCGFRVLAWQRIPVEEKEEEEEEEEELKLQAAFAGTSQTWFTAKYGNK